MPPRGTRRRQNQNIRNPHAVALSKLGASKGGKARAMLLSRKRRLVIAKKAAAHPWGARNEDQKA